MKKTSAPLLALLATLATAAGSMRLWWTHATKMETRYIVDYLRFTLNLPSYSFWPYRIEAVQHLSPTVLPDAVFGGRPLYVVLLWPLIATVAVGIISLVVAASAHANSQGNSGERILSGAEVIGRWRWNFPLMCQKSKRGFYINTK